MGKGPHRFVQENRINHTAVRITILGAGNLATMLGSALKTAGHEFVQVYSRTEDSARKLAHLLGAESVVDAGDIHPDVELYICALKDDALVEVLSKVRFGQGTVVHTAGSLPLDILSPFAAKSGVFYPLQTFSKEREISFSDIPIYVESNDPDTLEMLSKLAGGLSSNVQSINYEQRLCLHVSAVFACNFVNHLYTIANDLLAEKDLDFKDLQPLVRETAAKVANLSPDQAQTGPAIRLDSTILDKHLRQLDGHPDWQALYQALSQSIHQRHSITTKQ
jgi:predicted short-subunit dehydrogenase-like oxidoreductase (DUF2520 family)